MSDLHWQEYTNFPHYRHPMEWMPPGSYTGRGPQGYRRSDDRIGEDVCERLTWHSQLDASDIEVTVNKGQVTLEGTVDSRWAKQAAEEVDDSVFGVADVHNRLRVNKAGETRWAENMTALDRSVRSGMEVYGTDGERIGEVKEVRGRYECF